MIHDYYLEVDRVPEKLTRKLITRPNPRLFLQNRPDLKPDTWNPTRSETQKQAQK